LQLNIGRSTRHRSQLVAFGCVEELRDKTHHRRLGLPEVLGAPLEAARKDNGVAGDANAMSQVSLCDLVEHVIEGLGGVNGDGRRRETAVDTRKMHPWLQTAAVGSWGSKDLVEDGVETVVDATNAVLGVEHKRGILLSHVSAVGEGGNDVCVKKEGVEDIEPEGGALGELETRHIELADLASSPKEFIELGSVSAECACF